MLNLDFAEQQVCIFKPKVPDKVSGKCYSSTLQTQIKRPWSHSRWESLISRPPGLEIKSRPKAPASFPQWTTSPRWHIQTGN